MQCPADRPNAGCFQYINPFSANAYQWAAQGIQVTSPDALIGGPFIEFDDGVLGCTGVDCDGPETPLPPLEYPAADTLPDGWDIAVACAVDVPERVLSDVIVSYLPSTIPNSCISSCEAQGYHFAGVEYGDECYCGTGYSGGVVPAAANISDCNVRCAGEYYISCGGSWRMQIYSDI
ncbi:hypothetical protein PHLCEN_2v12142 [Hermanssonia centrifuga]|uniref:WSC domain-containing protein n=1 Tax=Hermanssonia centrifuga TaxID=98765 RepID=A0A2R6NIV4_9APHY|nr:hypothetical protein PHLCEN_2v12142 [Hermanssonia centrifuga]